MRTAEKNCTEHIRDEFIEKSLLTMTGTIETQIRQIEGKIREIIASSPELTQKSELIQPVPGGDPPQSGDQQILPTSCVRR